MSNFIHLTNKTEYSLSEGALPIGRIAELCQSFQMPAVGISDTNNMFGALEFSERISQVGVQPIVGCNIKIKTPKEYLHENIQNNDIYFFLNIYSKNEKGYENLLKLMSTSYMTDNVNAYLSIDELKKYNDGLIVLSGGNNSILAHSNDSYTTSQSSLFIKDFKKIFKDNFYIEIQRLGNSNYRLNENSILNLANDHHVPLVATNDVYFEGPEYYEAHDALMCIEKKLYVSQLDRNKLSREHYFKSQEEMSELFIDLPEAINNTLEIAQRCSHRPNTKMPILPVFDKDLDKEKMLLNKLSCDGLTKRLDIKFRQEHQTTEDQKKITQHYQQRLDKELNIITLSLIHI